MRVMGIWPDMTDPDSIAAEFAKVNEAFGRIDILGNNAGVSARESIYDYDPAAFDKTMALNVNAVFYCCKAVAPFMARPGRRRHYQHKLYGEHLRSAFRLRLSPHPSLR